MRNDLIKANTPEEAELAKKKAELERLSDVLAEKELDIEDEEFIQADVVLTDIDRKAVFERGTAG